VDGDVQSVPKGGGNVVPLSPYAGGPVMVIAADDSGVYGIDIWCSVVKLGQGGAATQVLATVKLNAPACDTQIALDATALYWSGMGSSIPQVISLYSVPKVGGAAAALLTCASPGMNPGVAVDATSVFWPANSPESILRLSK
jgi:hypothetical protein